MARHLKENSEQKSTFLIAILGTIIVIFVAVFVIFTSLSDKGNIFSDREDLTIISSEDVTNPSVVLPEKNPCGIKFIDGKINTLDRTINFKIDFDASQMIIENVEGEDISDKIIGACSNNYLIINATHHNKNTKPIKCYFQGDISEKKITGFYTCRRYAFLKSEKPVWSGDIIK